MITGEYAVIDGAWAFAVPTKKGQKMNVKAHSGADIVWHSYDHEGKVWFESEISLYDFSAIKTTDEAISKKLQKYLKESVQLNCEFLDKWNGFKVETHLEFPLDWGLGSSSSLIYLISKWADINAMELYYACEKGSGYDVACAGAKSPIDFLNSPEQTSFSDFDYNPPFLDKLWFVHLGKKVNSAQSIEHYNEVVKDKKTMVKKISDISEAIMDCKDFNDFKQHLTEHENIIASHTGFKKVKDEFFSDFNGIVKSLGAWGGDFVLVTGDAEYVKSYFAGKGLNTIVSYKEMVLN